MKRVGVTYALQEPSQTPFDFAWEVARDGYEWVRAVSADPNARNRTPATFLTDGVPWGSPSLVHRSAPPRSDGALFRTFAELSPSAKAVRDFANAHGLLGGAVSEMIALPRRTRGGMGFDIADGVDRVVATGERLASWARHITALHGLVTLLDAATYRSPHLAERIVWYADRVQHHQGRSWALISGVHTDPERFARLRRGDLRTPAFLYLQKQVNDRLAEQVAARLLWTSDRTQLRLHVVPGCLLAALWLQFARAIEGNRRYIGCGECGRWMELSPDVRRSDARFCSGACRTRAHRRLRRAVTLKSRERGGGRSSRRSAAPHPLRASET